MFPVRIDWASKSRLDRHQRCFVPTWRVADTLSYRKINTSPTTIEDKEALKKPLCTPMIKKIDLHFKTGLSVTARNMKGVTIKDALDAIYKQCKKKVRGTPT